MSVLGDAFDVRRSIVGDGPLRVMSDAGVLDSADVHTALNLSEVVGGADDAVLVAAALAVRAVRLGHVYVDLATVSVTAAPEGEDGTEPDDLPWPDPGAWPAVVAANPMTAVGVAGPADRPLRLLGSRLYLDRYWRYERSIAADLLRRSAADAPPVDTAALTSALIRLFPPEHGMSPGDDHQLLAAATAVLRRFTVIAGGPGTGKTTTVARLLVLLHEQAHLLGGPPLRVALAAPTGKAAARLTEAVHAEAAAMDVDTELRASLLASSATTLHRLLGWQPGNRSRFRHDGTDQLPHNVVIVDETSMVSLSMMAKLLAAVRDTARLVLVGDPQQLASVEAGAVLGDIVGPASRQLMLRPPARAALEAVAGAPIASTEPPPGATIGDGIVALDRVHRFGGGIASLARAIETGDADQVIDLLKRWPTDVTWLDTEAEITSRPAGQLATIRKTVVEAATAVATAARAGDRLAALDALQAVQVLCAHRRGPFGASVWRAQIEGWLRNAIPQFGAGPWYAGRPLLVTENDYQLGVFNGDTGVVVDIGDGRLRAVFERRAGILTLRPGRLASVDSLYAMTIHKAQGSQFNSVIVVLPEPTSRVLTRELLYTAVTRAKSRLTIVGPEASVRAAVTAPIARASGLADSVWPKDLRTTRT